MKRDIASVLAAYSFKPDKIDLFVEGKTDKDFLLFLTGYKPLSNVTIVEVGSILFDQAVLGGEKGRLLYLAERLRGVSDRSRCLADGDSDGFFYRPIPGYVFRTDLRDLESYAINDRTIQSLLQMKYGVQITSISSLMKSLIEVGKCVGLLRNWAELMDIKLPFQKTSILNHLSIADCLITLDLSGYLGNLMQNAQISLRQKDEYFSLFQEFETTHASTNALNLIHGKDFIDLLTAYLKDQNVRKPLDSRDLLLCFNAAEISNHPVLLEVVAFLK